MKKIFCGMVVLLMVSLGLFINCNKAEQSAREAINESTGVVMIQAQAKSQAPIIIDDMEDFQFTSGWNVPGTLFQANFYWDKQDGQRISLSIKPGKQAFAPYWIQGATKRFYFEKGDIVTVVFKVISEDMSKYKCFDFVSIKEK